MRVCAAGDAFGRFDAPSSSEAPMATTDDVEILEEPRPPGLFVEYTKTRQEAGDAGPSAPPEPPPRAVPKRVRDAPRAPPAAAAPSGPMARFYRRSKKDASE